jgi:hypothetical protein
MVPMSPFTLEADFIGTLAKVLTDLQGYETLARELIQNADDAAGDDDHPGATSMRFDVREDAVVVSNDGVFSFCGADDKDCACEPRCDVHAFLRVASETKRERDDTTGAFGIGFTAVYQVTDRPELISAGLHITLCPEAANAEDRVRTCHGCPTCDQQSGTVLRLPWAEVGSELRVALGQEARHDPDGIADALAALLRDALPFLRRVRLIELLREGRPVATFRCERDDDRVYLHGPGDEVLELQRLVGDFDEDAARLRELPDAPIEPKRSSKVEILVGETLTEGRLYAVLPTDERLPATVLVSADFFPHSNRRTINLDDGIRADWNRAALRAVGNTLSEHLGALPARIGVVPTWRLISLVHRTSDEATDSSLQSLWGSLEPEVTTAQIAPRVDGTCMALPALLFVPAPEDDVANAVLAKLEVDVLAPSVRDLVRSLPRSEMGMEELSAKTLSSALDNAPITLTAPELQTLWGLMSRVLGRTAAAAMKTAESLLASTPTAPCRDGSLRCWSEVHRGDATTQVLLAPYLSFLDDDTLGEHRRLAELAGVVRVADAIDVLSEAEQVADPLELVRWFYDRRDGWSDDDGLTVRLRALPIFPTRRGSARTFVGLSELVMTDSKAGAFVDEAQIAKVLDITAGEDVRKLAALLEIPRLTLREYVERQIPLAMADAGDGVPGWLHDLLCMLAEHREEIRNDPQMANALAGLAFVPCGGTCLVPSEALFSSEATTVVLGPSWPTYDGPAAAADLLFDLGVSDRPRPHHVRERVRQLTEQTPDDAAVVVVHEILRLIAAQQAMAGSARASEIRTRLKNDYSELFTAAWLPAVGDRSRWYAPQDIYRRQREHLFRSQAAFLDAPPRIQNEAVDVLEALNVEVEPSVAMVIAHLRHCSDTGSAAHADIYRKLDNEVDDPAIAELREFPSLRRLDGSWVRPDEAFWEEHGLGRLATRLDAHEWNAWRRLLEEIGVRAQPDHRDALRVLAMIVDKDLAPGDRLPIVARCWQLLESSLDAGDIQAKEINAALGDRPCVLDEDQELLRPPEVYADDRPQLAAMLRPLLGPALITRPSASWLALQAAGVTAVSTRLVAVPRFQSATPHRPLERLLRERRPQVARLLESALGSAGGVGGLARLDELQLRAAPGLSVTWRFAPDPRVSIEVPDVGAVWAREQDIVYVDGELGGMRLVDIARELAFALDADPSHLAVLRDVLELETSEEADDYLDRLSIPRLTATVPMSTAELAGHGAGEEESEYVAVVAQPPDEELAPATPEPDEQDEPGAHDGGEQGAAEQGAAERRPARPRGSGVSRSGTSGGRGTTTNGGSRSRSSDVTPSEWWRVIVSGRGREPGDDPERTAVPQTRRLEIGRAGVAAVLDYERSNGRHPVEMEHDHPGYDVESYDNGRVVRYIEVKSLAGEWGSGGMPNISPKQVDVARVNGKEAWLYVVELAEVAPRITAINDPVAQATAFVFDPGWRELGESPDDADT